MHSLRRQEFCRLREFHESDGPVRKRLVAPTQLAPIFTLNLGCHAASGATAELSLLSRSTPRRALMPIATINPYSEQTLQLFEPLTPEQLNDKLELSATAFSRHRRTTFADRAVWMSRVGDILERDKERLARLITLEMGKPLIPAGHEIEKCALVCRYYAK